MQGILYWPLTWRKSTSSLPWKSRLFPGKQREARNCQPSPMAEGLSDLKRSFCASRSSEELLLPDLLRFFPEFTTEKYSCAQSFLHMYQSDIPKPILVLHLWNVSSSQQKHSTDAVAVGVQLGRALISVDNISRHRFKVFWCNNLTVVSLNTTSSSSSLNLCKSPENGPVPPSPSAYLGSISSSPLSCQHSCSHSST